MRNSFLSILLLIPLLLAANIKLTVTNPNSVDLKDAPVVVKLATLQKLKVNKANQLAVFIEGKQVSSQLDDLNKDGKADELVFLTDLKAGEKKKVRLKYMKDKKRINFPSEIYVSFIQKEADGTHKDVLEVSSTKNDMYNKLHHHGIAFESELMAYRIYFDNKSTIDLYGKKKHRLEIPDTKWYPTAEQLATGYGDDILLVSGWVGVGTVKGYENEKMTHINRFDLRTQRIVASGKVRSVIESEVKGWEYEGKKVDLTVRYILYARHRDVIAEVTASEDINQIATGVQDIGNGIFLESNDLVGSWGSWHPQPDKVKYPKETVGLGVYVPQQLQGKQVIYDVNNLIVFPLKKNQIHRFYLTALADKEEKNTIHHAEDFFNYLKTWSQGLQTIAVK
jgi:hypothetical protein